jgi:hypothetical protein
MNSDSNDSTSSLETSETDALVPTAQAINLEPAAPEEGEKELPPEPKRKPLIVDSSVGKPTYAQQDELTYGEKVVGLAFYPGNNRELKDLKVAYAALLDSLHYLRLISRNPEVCRQLSVAITELQTSQMWAESAATWKY